MYIWTFLREEGICISVIGTGPVYFSEDYKKLNYSKKKLAKILNNFFFWKFIFLRLYSYVGNFFKNKNQNTHFFFAPNLLNLFLHSFQKIIRKKNIYRKKKWEKKIKICILKMLLSINRACYQCEIPMLL